ncbi:4171_t:CDS:2 [Ambispora gerdemannii]|uniref:4171_t:CDS:1 n=1 Tax=Ambispora gerdemannii TaxID=144530 RepID=A0A9N9GEJ9_9GLOM|nr:4171_t:CDS:2 [Ambispora gerdemannii]
MIFRQLTKTLSLRIIKSHVTTLQVPFCRAFGSTPHCLAAVESVEAKRTPKKESSPKKASSAAVKTKTARSISKTKKEPIPKPDEGPKKPGSSYNFFYSEKMQKIRAENPSMRVSEIMKKVGDLWSNSSEEEKKPYQEKFTQAKQKYDEAYKKWFESMTSLDIIRQNALRKAHKKKPMKDPSYPKRAVSSYMIFNKWLQTQPSAANIESITERAKYVAEEWKKLSPEEKKKWEDLYMKDKARFNAEVNEYQKKLANLHV